jgi:hypothetical protein
MNNYVKSNPVRDIFARIAWARGHDRCQVCWTPREMLASADIYPQRLEVHHIVKAGRSDEPTNLLMVCSRCHRVIEGERVPSGGKGYWPRLGLCNILWVKSTASQEEYDRDRLTLLLRNRERTAIYDPLPCEKELPEPYLAEREKWRHNRKT